MAAIVIRNLSPETHRALQARAARHGRSMEAEARTILDEAVRPTARVKLGSALAALAGPLGRPRSRNGTRPDPGGADPAAMIPLDTNVVSEPIAATSRPPGAGLARCPGHRDPVSVDDQPVRVAARDSSTCRPASVEGRSPPHSPSKSRACSAIASFRSMSPPRELMQRSSPARADKGMRSRSPTGKSPPSPPPAPSGSPRATKRRFRPPASL